MLSLTLGPRRIIQYPESSNILYYQVSKSFSNILLWRSRAYLTFLYYWNTLYLFIYIKNSWHIINKYEWTAYCTVCMYDSYNTVKCVDKIVAYCTYMYRCDSYEQNVYRTLQHTTIHICCTLYSMIAIYAICMECVHEIVGYCTVHYRICVCYEGGKCREPKTGQQKVQLSSKTKHFANLGMIRILFCFINLWGN